MLELKDITFEVKDGEKTRRILNDVSFKFEPGQLDRGARFYIGLSYAFFAAMLLGIIIGLVCMAIMTR